MGQCLYYIPISVTMGWCRVVRRQCNAEELTTNECSRLVKYCSVWCQASHNFSDRDPPTARLRLWLSSRQKKTRHLSKVVRVDHMSSSCLHFLTLCCGIDGTLDRRGDRSHLWQVADTWRLDWTTSTCNRSEKKKMHQEPLASIH